ncbi:MAG: NAD(+)/NADH kinase [Thermomicrobiales bacterium]|nr:NAD(+)/NADH kinase [Thermomicrobiales bacterium]
MTEASSIGIIANPASGKDIRRIVAHGSTFDNHEKINIVRRVLLAVSELGVGQVHYLPDLFGIVPRAAENLELNCSLEPLPMPVLGNPGDSLEAAQRLVDLDVGAIVTLGGDGTNRVVAKGCRDIPLMPISTGTNNVFPCMVEGTLAGIATALVATGATPGATIRQAKLDVYVDGELCDLALIDAVLSAHQWVGARALWDASHLTEVVVSRIVPSAIGICGIGGLLFPDKAGMEGGAHVVVGGDDRTLLAPVAPGLLRSIPISAANLLAPGDRVVFQPAAGTVALDGEREIEIKTSHEVAVELSLDGPYTIDIDHAIASAAAQERFLTETAGASGPSLPASPFPRS